MLAYRHTTADQLRKITVPQRVYLVHNGAASAVSAEEATMRLADF